MLEELAKNDKQWRKMALQICGDRMLADDLVQEMYLKFSNYTNEVNKYYVFFAIRDIFYSSKDKRYTKNKITFVDINENDIFEVESYDFEKDKLCEEILNEVENLPYFKREILKVTQSISQRELARQTDISFETINKTIKKTKDEIKLKIWQSEN